MPWRETVMSHKAGVETEISRSATFAPIFHEPDRPAQPSSRGDGGRVNRDRLQGQSFLYDALWHSDQGAIFWYGICVTIL